MQRHSPSQIAHLQSLARLIRYLSVNATSKAHSGHLTSALSAADLMTGLMFGGTFRFKVDKPDHPNNDRLIFSKGHASPLLYALWTVAGAIDEQELQSYRQFGSRLEGHHAPLPLCRGGDRIPGPGSRNRPRHGAECQSPRPPAVPHVRAARRLAMSFGIPAFVIPNSLSGRIAWREM